MSANEDIQPLMGVKAEANAIIDELNNIDAPTVLLKLTDNAVVPSDAISCLTHCHTFCLALGFEPSSKRGVVVCVE
ncbi:hypothetical protein [Spongiibacter tropicus]|uniref:hypothetical protein n=1 Tax=Spongiibacter tropicus TaxID=454602 RepID=UPI0030081794